MAGLRRLGRAMGAMLMVAGLAVAGLALAGLAPPAAGARLPPWHARTGRAAAVTAGSAQLRGVVRGGGRTARYWFQYGTGPRYGAHTPAAALGGAGGRHAWGWRRARADVSRLAPATTYHFRLVASGCGAGCRRGTVYGRDATFTTAGYANAVYGPGEAADPSVLAGDAGGGYWVYTTGDRFPVLRSFDLVHWQPAGTAFAARPGWVSRRGDWHPWAPNVTAVDGACPGTSSARCYVMYYVGHSARFSVNCVGVAVATAPGGPFADRGPLAAAAPDALGRPAGCGDAGGFDVIDPSLFVDPPSGQAYLYVSVGYTCPAGSVTCPKRAGALAPTISVIPLSADLLSAAGPRTPLFGGTPGTWEAAGAPAPTVEGPAATLHDGTYYLLYSGGSWRRAYGMGYATAPSPTGPFTKAPAPILAATPGVGGSGGGEAPVVGPHGGLWIVYHGRGGGPASPRTLRIDPFSWQSAPDAGQPDVPVIAGPTTTPQPLQP